MKKIFLAAMAATVMFASCSNEGETPNLPEGETATVTVQIAPPESMRTISQTAPAATDDQTITGGFNVFITNQQRNKILSKKYQSAATDMTITDVSTQARYVYVVANTDGDITANVTSMADLYKNFTDLNGTNVQGRQTAKRWATGVNSTPLSFASNGAGGLEASTTVQVKFIAARIVLEVKNQMDPAYSDGAGKTLKINSVAVLNARGQSRLFPETGTSLIPASFANNKKFYTGLENRSPESFFHFPATNLYSYVTTAGFLTDVFTASTGFTTDKFYYYVFENDADEPGEFPTIVTLVGTYNDQAIYFPVHLASYETFVSTPAGTTFVTRGNSYQITMTLKGDPTIKGDGTLPGDTGGTDDPTIPMTKGQVTVNVTVAPWNPVVLSKEFS